MLLISYIYYCYACLIVFETMEKVFEIKDITGLEMKTIKVDVKVSLLKIYSLITLLMWYMEGIELITKLAIHARHDS